MRKLMFFACLCLVCVMGFVSCSREEERYSFKAEIVEIFDGSANVTPNEGEDILSSGDLVSISLKNAQGEFLVGDEIIVYYTGEVMESYPLQVNVLEVEKVE